MLHLSGAGTHASALPQSTSRPFIGSRTLRCRRQLRCQPLASVATTTGYAPLASAYEEYKNAPPSQKFDYAKGVLQAMDELKAAGTTKKWGVAVETPLERRNVFQGELKQVGIKQPGQMAVGSTRNDLAFLVTVVGTTSVLAVLAGQLPGDWGFFSAYLIGGISIAVLAIGSTAPGILQFGIDSFNMVFPDYKERVVRHEAGHFLCGYLVGLPVTNYSLLMGSQHTEFAEAKIGKRIIERQLEDSEIDTFAIVAVAGMAAEGQQYEEVMGQMADLSDLQRILLRSKSRLSDQQQQNMTRWAVLTAARLLREYKKEHEALMAAMARGDSTYDCVKAIESV